MSPLTAGATTAWEPGLQGQIWGMYEAVCFCFLFSSGWGGGLGEEVEIAFGGGRETRRRKPCSGRGRRWEAWAFAGGVETVELWVLGLREVRAGR